MYACLSACMSHSRFTPNRFKISKYDDDDDDDDDCRLV